MPTRKQLSQDEIQRAFDRGIGDHCSPILSLAQVSDLIGVAKKTLYQWIAQGRLDGTFRKRGKHYLFWRDRVIETLFNGPEWR